MWPDAHIDEVLTAFDEKPGLGKWGGKQAPRQVCDIKSILGSFVPGSSAQRREGQRPSVAATRPDTQQSRMDLRAAAALQPAPSRTLDTKAPPSIFMAGLLVASERCRQDGGRHRQAPLCGSGSPLSSTEVTASWPLLPPESVEASKRQTWTLRGRGKDQPSPS